MNNELNDQDENLHMYNINVHKNCSHVHNEEFHHNLICSEGLVVQIITTPSPRFSSSSTIHVTMI